MHNLNLKIRRLKIIDILPEYFGGKLWYCIGFEYKDRSMGDFFHLAFIYSKKFKENTPDLWKSLKTIFSSSTPYLRIHSECILSETFGSDLCDCAYQLRQSMRTVEENDCGIMIYLRQEGRGLGLRAKLPALALQQGYNKGKYLGRYMGKYLTSDGANIILGHPIDLRKYDIVPEFLKVIKATKVKLITGNLEKAKALEDAGIKIKEFVDVAHKSMKSTDHKFIEIKEKLNRNYVYPSYEKLLQN